MAVFGHIMFVPAFYYLSQTFYMAENGHIKGGKNLYSDNFLLFWGGFAVILPTFSCEMRVNFIYMTLFKQK